MKRFNLNEFIWFLILCGLLFLILNLVLTGEIFLLINIKMKKYIILAILIIFILSIVQFNQIFTIPPRGRIKLGYIIFIIALVFLAILPKVNILKTSLDFKGVKLYHDKHVNKDHLKKENHELLKSEKLILKKDNFHEGLEIIMHELDNFLGKEIYIEGIIYEDEFYKDKFILTDIDMNCCIVDSSYLGVLCKKNSNINVSNGEYVRLKGKLDKILIKDTNNKEIWVPLIYVHNLNTNISK
ncbi:DUF1980 domain-containing protein [Clostridium tarantellae]|uniref:DUF1980 domain-containing protein n=1 Tax=Clostridium tarantellae TaxID=39493 RepID=A0A6I1MGC3_9CLOT|nr:DUF1980 domain-containing protein [Clostridium tarantellae]MPQ42576.1 DUF1980 domain-containing protein [Clostridium tarantellae]